MKILALQQFPQILKSQNTQCNDSKKFIRISIGIGTFISLFLLIFRPFGIKLYSYESWLSIIGLGALNTMLLLINHFGIRPVVMKTPLSKLPSQLKQIAWGVWNLLSIAFGNFLCINALSGFNGLEVEQFAALVGKVLLIAIIPKTFLMMYSRIKELEKKPNYNGRLSGIQSKQETDQAVKNGLNIYSESGTEAIKIALSDLLFVRAEDNYVNVHFLKNGEPKKALLRNSLKNIERQLQDYPVIRCHRSYIVNLHRVTKLSGNAQGMTISLKEYSTAIPVSRKYISAAQKAVLTVTPKL